MTFGDPDEYDFTAEDIINEWEEHVLADVLFGTLKNASQKNCQRHRRS